MYDNSSAALVRTVSLATVQSGNAVSLIKAAEQPPCSDGFAAACWGTPENEVVSTSLSTGKNKDASNDSAESIAMQKQRRSITYDIGVVCAVAAEMWRGKKTWLGSLLLLCRGSALHTAQVSVWCVTLKPQLVEGKH